MRTIKATTIKGIKMLERASKCFAFTLSQIYDNYSESKETDYSNFWERFSEDEFAFDFKIGNPTNAGFMATWLTKYNGRNVRVIATHYNFWKIFLD